ncbi:MAG: hypothetical protein HMLKMBBP_02063 [Planctomycetes bacterium]|nr:hypothetical protein [Planctomycetota bacterium]
MSSSIAGRVVFAVGVVAASAAAAWFASSHGRGEPAPATGMSSNAMLLARLDELERRLDNQSRQIERIRETADTALRRASEAAEREPGSGADAASPGDGSGGAPVEPRATGRRPGTEPTNDELVAERMRSAQEVATKVQVNLLRHHMALLADETEQGQRDRATQAFADGRGLALRMEATEDQEAKIQGIVADEMNALVREVGPLVRAGVESAETDVLVARHEAVWAETDRKLRAVLDDAQWKAWTVEAEATRKRQTMLLRSFRPQR